MVPNQMNAGWLRPILALLAVCGLAVLTGCGGGSGAPNNPFTPPPPTVGPVFVLPASTTIYSHTPATLTVSGGAAPYQAFSSNSAVLPVAQAVSTGTIVLLANDVSAATSVTITVQDALGQTATSLVTVQPAPLFGTLTVVPSLTTCGTNAVCSGGTATATVTVTGNAGALLPNRQVRFDVISGAYAIQTTNPSAPLVSTLTVVSDANGVARVTLQATVNAPTQPAVIRATDLTTGNAVSGAFTIVQQTNGATILSVVPATATITGPDTATCSAGFRTDYFIYGGTPPYNVSSTFPASVILVNSVVTASGGFFEAITNGSCVNPLTFTIVDSTGRTTTATLINNPGTAAPPVVVPPPVAIVVTPGAQASAACTGATFSVLVTGGTPPFSIGALGQFTAPTGGRPLPIIDPQTLKTGGTVAISNLRSGQPTAPYNFTVVDSATSQQVANFSITCL